jgi:arginyl-tRNA synthetase
MFAEPVERELAILVRRTPVVIGQACENFRPNFLAEHLFQVANTFASFYGQCPVLVDDADLRASRLALCKVTAEALTAGLRLLGLTPLERM